jgi:hypothetical protein
MRGDLPNLHDAILESVSVDFQSGTAELRVVLVGGGVIQLACKPFRRVAIDRDQPWGPSGFIMGVTGGNERLDIEMQSGDHVLIYGPEMEVSLSSHGPAD